MTKISQLAPDTTPQPSDLFAMVDNANGQTKKVTVATILQTGGLIAKAGLNAELQEKLTGTAFSYRINNGTGTRSTATASMTDIPGTPNITITAGTRAIKIHVHLIIMGNNTTGGGQQCYINVNGTNRPAGMYFDGPSHWQVQHIYEIVDVAAGQSAVIKAQYQGAGLQLCNASADTAYPEFINGWVQVV
jgi:hypothetical protein